MMEPLRSYMLSVVTAAILCALVSAIAGQKSNAAPFLRLLSGIFLALTVIRPIAEVKVEEFLRFADDLKLEAGDAVAVGTSCYQNSFNELIRTEIGTYIMDKAQTLNASVTVEVILDEASVPRDVTIRGQISDDAKGRLSNIIASDLGIPKERQIWIVSSSG